MVYITILLTLVLLALITVHTGFNSIYTQLFFIPIALTGIWSGRKGIGMALLYGLTGVVLSWLATGNLSTTGIFQAAMFLIVAAVIGVPSDRRSKLLDLIRESEEKFRMIASNVGAGVMAADREGKVIFVSPAAAGITGYTQDGRQDSGSSMEAVASFRQAIAENKPVSRDIEVYAENGDKKIIELRVAPASNTGETTTGFVGTLHDLTECRKAQAALQELSNFNSSILESFPGLIWRSNQDGKGVHFSRNWLAFTGRSPEQEADDGWQYSVHQEDLGRRQQAFEEARKAGREFECVYRLRRVDSVYRWMLEICRPIADAEGRFSGYVSFVYDITERRVAVEELEAENRHLHTMYSISSTISQHRDMKQMFDIVLKETNSLISAGAGAIYIEDTDRRGVMKLAAQTNDGAFPAVFAHEVIFSPQTRPREIITEGVSPEEWIEECAGPGQMILVPLKSAIHRVGAIAFYFPARPDSSACCTWDQSHVNRLISIGAQLGIVIDCAMQYNRLLKENGRLAEIVEHSPDAMLTIDASGHIRTFNRQACRLLRYSAIEVAGKHISTIFPPGSSIRIDPDQNYIREFRAGDESLIKLNISAAQLSGPEESDGLIITLKDLSAVSGVKIVPVCSNACDDDKEGRFKKGIVYLIDKHKIDYHMDIFADQVRQTTQGLCISRQPPGLIRDRYKLEHTPVIWLSNGDTSAEKVIKPEQINSLLARISEFINSNDNGIVMLDGIEYLMARNGFDTMLKFAQFLNDKLMISNCCAMFCIDTQTLDERQLHLLLSEMTEFREN